VTRRRVLIVGAGLALIVVASAAAAQFQGRGRGFVPVRLATPEDYDGAFLFCRIFFRSYGFGDGGGWQVDYPRADINFPFRLSELTKTSVSRDSTGSSRHVVVRFTAPEIFRCPFVMMTEPGGSYIDEAEAAGLRDYLLKGGFLWADDFWGERAWYNWAEQIGKALPSGQYPIVDLTSEHPLFHTLYDVQRLPQIPSINFWFGSGGATSERGFESADPHARAIFDEHGRMMVLMTHNTDFGDSFERETDDRNYFLAFAPEGYAFAVNALLYAMSH
jgi:hypothetical protein